MTKKDYVLIATAIAASRGCKLGEDANTEWFRKGQADVAYVLAGALERENPRFDRARFLAACGVYS